MSWNASVPARRRRRFLGGHPVCEGRSVGIVLRTISAADGEGLCAGQVPPDLRVATDYPTEFSAGVGRHAGTNGALGPFFLHRSEDGVVVGEIGGGFVQPGVVEIGYAVVTSCWGRGYATEAVRALVERARPVAGVERMVGHTPLDRPASGRVLEKAPTGASRRSTGIGRLQSDGCARACPALRVRCRAPTWQRAPVPPRRSWPS